MPLTPRYAGEPVVELDGVPGDIAHPVIRQRQRLAAAVATFDTEQWSHPSRCDGWTNRDVIVHLDSTNSFWSFAISQGLRGEPTTLLATFDPVSSPAQLVAAAAGTSTGEVLDRFVASTEALVDALASLDDGGWVALAEAPPGHIAVNAVAHHALWDAWVHERDIFVPMDVTPDEEPDEIVACLRYAAALGPALALNRGATGRGSMVVDVSDPDVTFVVEIGDRVVVRNGDGAADVRLSGGAVDVLEALSIRRPLAQHVPPAAAWMLAGLSETFDAST